MIQASNIQNNVALRALRIIVTIFVTIFLQKEVAVSMVHHTFSSKFIPFSSMHAFMTSRRSDCWIKPSSVKTKKISLKSKASLDDGLFGCHVSTKYRQQNGYFISFYFFSMYGSGLPPLKFQLQLQIQNIQNLIIVISVSLSGDWSLG